MLVCKCKLKVDIIRGTIGTVPPFNLKLESGKVKKGIKMAKEYYVEISDLNGKYNEKYNMSNLALSSDGETEMSLSEIVEHVVGMWAFYNAADKCKAENILDYDNNNEFEFYTDNAQEILNQYTEEFKNNVTYKIYELVASK